MRVEITEIDRGKLAVVGDGTVLGYWGRFKCAITAGAAIFVPYSNHEGNLRPGVCISVETNQASISDFALLPTDTPPIMTQLETPGDYEMVGIVTVVFDDSLVFVDVGGFRFALDANETEGRTPQAGQHVKFRLHQLSLWDENI